ncbi:hypothetical protein BU23DRAFT_649376 [Bimuria novae-zelandiae CBS 107.79]|uniref:Uncharacterized protein n=1 Tax=Bimuria novae-zelandiae CBS 107.79 TaxID=1447943 RepID=A0A6A5V3R3_9PLEO|nr:hypothetical protein BU23DRAFT_649376 [Bimuria novae-zelandiae CBS 107.79]
MADPLTALGAASNIIQLVDIAWRLISDTREIYQSGEGLCEDHLVLDTIAQDAIMLNNAITASTTLKLGPASRTLHALILESSKVARDLVAALEEIRKQTTMEEKSAKAGLRSVVIQAFGVKDSGNRKVPMTKRRWDCFRAALKGIWTKDKIKGFIDRLGKLQEQVSVHIDFLIFQHLREQSDMIVSLEQTSKNLGVTGWNELHQVADKISAKLDQMREETRETQKGMLKVLELFLRVDDHETFVQIGMTGSDTLFLLDSVRALREGRITTKLNNESLGSLHFSKIEAR